jgi:hypothetical protein
MPNEQQTKAPGVSTGNYPSQTLAPQYAFKPNQDHSPEPNLKFPKLGEIIDIENTLWDVREIRPTKHGFDMHYGTRASRAYNGRIPRLIATIDLMEFWSANGTRHDGFLFDLPASHHSLTSMRARLGFNFFEATAAFWEDRIADLASLSSQEFATRHGVTPCSAASRRYRIFGTTLRPRGWWRKRNVLTLLLSSQTLRKVGAKLSISSCHAFHLRARARQEYGINAVNTKLISFPVAQTPGADDYNPPIAA